jgi:hypothetical protein
MMRPPHKPNVDRMRRIAKWSGTTGCLLLTAAWVCSAWSNTSCWVRRGGVYTTVCVSVGAIYVFRETPLHPTPERRHFSSGFGGSGVPTLRWSFLWRWLPNGQGLARVPLWAIFMPAVTGTAWAW